MSYYAKRMKYLADKFNLKDGLQVDGLSGADRIQYVQQLTTETEKRQARSLRDIAEQKSRTGNFIHFNYWGEASFKDERPDKVLGLTLTLYRRP